MENVRALSYLVNGIERNQALLTNWKYLNAFTLYILLNRTLSFGKTLCVDVKSLTDFKQTWNNLTEEVQMNYIESGEALKSDYFINLKSLSISGRL